MGCSSAKIASYSLFLLYGYRGARIWLQTYERLLALNIGRGFHFDGKNLVSLFHYEIYFRISLRIWVSPIAGFDSLSYQLLTYVLFYERALEFGKELRLVHQSIHVETGQCAQYARVFQIYLERVKTLISGQRNMQSIEAGTLVMIPCKPSDK